MSCEKRGNKLERCGQITTSNCVKFVGDENDCINLCSGISLTDVIEVFSNEICSIKQEIDLSNILPNCFTFSEKTFQIIIQALIDKSCDLQTSINTINTILSQFDPIIRVNGGCLVDNPCFTQTLKLSEILNLIISEICNVKGEISEIFHFLEIKNGEITSLQKQINTLNSNIDCLRDQFNAFVIFYNNHSKVIFTPPTCP